MKIKEILSEYRNDFTAITVCEHCGHEVLNPTGYHDNHYHTKVIPKMTCPVCKKDRQGDSRE